MKHGSAQANTLGTIAVMYSAFGVILTWLRGTDDDVNTLVSATATGMLYKSSGNFISILQKYCIYLKHKLTIVELKDIWHIAAIFFVSFIFFRKI